MTDAQRSLIGLLVYTALVVIATALTVDHWNKREFVAQVAHAEARTAPNDVALETAPGAKVTQPAPTKARGGKTVATTEVTVSGGAPQRVHETLKTEHDGANTLSGCPTAADFVCPDAHLRLDLVQTDDGQQYMAVRGDDDREIAGRYIPAAAIRIVRSKRITVVGNPGGDVVATFQRDFGRWSLAAAGWQIDGHPGAGAGGSMSW